MEELARKDKDEIPDIWNKYLVVATVILAIVTGFMAFFTSQMATESHRTADRTARLGTRRKPIEIVNFGIGK